MFRAFVWLNFGSQTQSYEALILFKVIEKKYIERKNCVKNAE